MAGTLFNFIIFADMDLGLNDKIIIVTGGAKGIGEGIVRLLAEEGAVPVIVGRNEEDNLKLVAALESLGRTLGPIWGNGALQFLGEGAAYGSAALVLLATAALTNGYRKQSDAPASR